MKNPILVALLAAAFSFSAHAQPAPAMPDISGFQCGTAKQMRNRMVDGQTLNVFVPDGDGVKPLVCTGTAANIDKARAGYGYFATSTGYIDDAGRRCMQSLWLDYMPNCALPKVDPIGGSLNVWSRARGDGRSEIEIFSVACAAPGEVIEIPDGCGGGLGGLHGAGGSADGFPFLYRHATK